MARTPTPTTADLVGLRARGARLLPPGRAPQLRGGFPRELRHWLATTAQRVDAALPSSGQVAISDKGEPVLRRGPRCQPSKSAQALEAALLERMPERNILDMLANVAHWTDWPRCWATMETLDAKQRVNRQMS